MTRDLQLTSVPTWATTSGRPDADLSGRSWTVVGFGGEARAVVQLWTAQICAQHPDAEIRVHLTDNGQDAGAAAAVSVDLSDALVGWRLMIAGPADACLRLRAHALRCGVADDEMVVASTEVDVRDVLCAHCGARSRAEVNIEDVTPCSGCHRNLFVYYHVSRLQGAYLGFMADAEQPAGAL